MLTELRLNSLGVVAEAVLPLGPGLTALTGETGAGKTMIVAGLGLLLGARADASLVRNGQDRALVQGRWEVGENTAEAVEALGGDLDDGVELVTLRQISSQGRSRATVGGVQVPVSTAAGLLTDLATIHGQSEQTRLSTPERQRELLDAFAAPAALEDYRRDFAEHRRITEELAGLEADAMNRAREIDVLRFGLEEIAAVNPGEGEDEALAAEAVRLADADDLKALAMTARVALSGSEEDLDAPSVLGLVGAARKALETLAATRVDVAVVGTNGLTAEHGLSTPDPDEAAVKRAMIRAAKHVVVLADATKIGQEHLVSFADLADIDLLVTDSPLPTAIATPLATLGTEVVTP